VARAVAVCHSAQTWLAPCARRAGLFFAAKTLRVKAEYSDSRAVLASLCTLLAVASLILGLMHFMPPERRSEEQVVYAEAFAVLLASTVSVLALMLPKLLRLRLELRQARVAPDGGAAAPPLHVTPTFGAAASRKGGQPWEMTAEEVEAELGQLRTRVRVLQESENSLRLKLSEREALISALSGNSLDPELADASASRVQAAARGASSRRRAAAGQTSGARNARHSAPQSL